MVFAFADMAIQYLSKLFRNHVFRENTQVKQQFGDNPEIYNKFLDIMKDFKSHAIDTQASSSHFFTMWLCIRAARESLIGLFADIDRCLSRKLSKESPSCSRVISPSFWDSTHSCRLATKSRFVKEGVHR
jgi:hypothetical protein